MLSYSVQAARRDGKCLQWCHSYFELRQRWSSVPAPLHAAAVVLLYCYHCAWCFLSCGATCVLPVADQDQVKPQVDHRLNLQHPVAPCRAQLSIKFAQVALAQLVTNSS
jgi:hypothetical protein